MPVRPSHDPITVRVAGRAGIRWCRGAFRGQMRRFVRCAGHNNGVSLVGRIRKVWSYSFSGSPIVAAFPLLRVSGELAYVHSSFLPTPCVVHDGVND